MSYSRTRRRSGRATRPSAPVGYIKEWPATAPPVPPYLWQSLYYAPDQSSMAEWDKSCGDEVHRYAPGRWTEGGPLLISGYEDELSTHSWHFLGLKPGRPSYMCDASMDSWHILSSGTKSVIVAEMGTLMSQANALENYGALAWNRFKPGKPDAGLGQFLAEIRDVPRTLRDTCASLKNLWSKKRPPTPKELGKDYITYQFGMAPFVRDVRSFYNLARNFEGRLQTIRKLNGKWTLRRGSVASTGSTTLYAKGTSYGYFSPCPGPEFVVPGSHGYTISAERSSRIWFSGRFRYYIPETEMMKPHWKANTGRKLAGLSLTPALVWELMPWSWLIDYFVDVGDLLSNLTTGVLGEVAAKYAYLMGTYEVRALQTSFVSFVNGVSWCGESSRTQTVKKRIEASPFGFGLTGELTASQAAILAALGISKV